MQSKQKESHISWMWELDLVDEGEGGGEDDPGSWLRPLGGGWVGGDAYTKMGTIRTSL